MEKVTLSITGATAFCCVKVSKPAKNGNLLCRNVSMLLATLYSICICAKRREDSLGLSLSDHWTPLTHACSFRRPTNVIMPCLMSLYQAKTWLEFVFLFTPARFPICNFHPRKACFPSHFWQTIENGGCLTHIFEHIVSFFFSNTN